MGIRETQLQTRVDGPVDPREIRGDIVLEAELGGEHFLVGIEWQSSRDAKMDERLLGYSHEITRMQGLNVLPCVVYMQPVNKIPQAPLERLFKRVDERKESIAAAFFFAGKVLKSEEGRTFLERKYSRRV